MVAAVGRVLSLRGFISSFILTFRTDIRYKCRQKWQPGRYKQPRASADNILLFQEYFKIEMSPTLDNILLSLQQRRISLNRALPLSFIFLFCNEFNEWREQVAVNSWHLSRSQDVIYGDVRPPHPTTPLTSHLRPSTKTTLSHLCPFTKTVRREVARDHP